MVIINMKNTLFLALRLAFLLLVISVATGSRSYAGSGEEKREVPQRHEKLQSPSERMKATAVEELAVPDAVPVDAEAAVVPDDKVNPSRERVTPYKPKPVSDARINPLGLVSLVLGALGLLSFGLLFVGGILAGIFFYPFLVCTMLSPLSVIVSVVGLVIQGKNRERYKHKWMALAGLLLNILLLVILGYLVLMLIFWATGY